MPLGRFVRRHSFELAYIPVVATIAGFALALSLTVGALYEATPDGVRSPENLVFLRSAGSVESYELLRQSSTLEATAFVRVTAQLLLADGSYRPIRVECVTPEYWRVLGVRPAVGRVPTPAPSTEALISPGLTTVLKSSSPLGDYLTLATSTGATVVGVAHHSFKGLSWRPVDVWLNLADFPRLCSGLGVERSKDSQHWLTIAGRVRSNASLNAVQGELQALGLWSGRTGEGVTGVLQSLRSQVAGEGDFLWWLRGACVAILALGMIGVAGVHDLRLRAMERELSVRSALGATPASQVRTLVLEAIVVAAVGGVGATLASEAIVSVVATQTGLAPSHWSVTAMALGAAGMLLVPALVVIVRWRLSLDRRSSLRDLESRHGLLRAGQLTSVFQIAAAVTCGMCVLQFGESMSATQRRLGYSLDSVIAADIDPFRTVFQDDEPLLQIRTLARDQLRQQPAFTVVALASSAPLQDDSLRLFVGLGRPGERPLQATINVNVITPDYFRLLGGNFRAGRSFNDGDTTDSDSVLIVDEGISSLLGGNVVGECLQVMSVGRCATVVGVSGQRRAHDIHRSRLEMFVPITQVARYRLPYTGRTILIKSQGRANVAARMVTSILQSVAPGVPLRVQALDDVFSQRIADWGNAMLLLAWIAGATVCLVGLTVFGIVGLALRQRERDVAVRVLLGGSMLRTVARVMRDMATVIAVGSAFGGIGGYVLTRMLASQYPGLSEVRASSAILVLLAVVSVAAVAGVLPLLRLGRLSLSRQLLSER